MKYLIVGDSKTIRFMLEQVILSAGAHEVTHAGCAEIALSKLEQDVTIQTVLLDSNMSGMSGFECLKVIRNHPEFNSIDVVMCTSESSRKMIADYFQFGANGFIRKPFTSETVAQILHLD